jgi:hypothetical protein
VRRTRHRMRAALLAALLCGSATIRLAAEGTAPIRLPAGSAARIDGILDPSEWTDAALIKIESGGDLRFKTSGAVFYCATEGLYGPDFGFACIFIQFDRTIYLLHASAQLGMVKYRYSEATRTWSPDTAQFAWTPRLRTWSEQGWMASTVPTDGPAAAQEFAIDLARLPEKADKRGTAFRLALVHFGGKYRDGRVFDTKSPTYPAALRDPCADIAVADENPTGVVFRPDTWASFASP